MFLTRSLIHSSSVSSCTDPQSIPENVGLEAVNDSTIKVAWLPVQKEGLNGHLKGFVVSLVCSCNWCSVTENC